MHQLPYFLLMCNAGRKVYTDLSYSSCPKERARASAACVCIPKSSINTENRGFLAYIYEPPNVVFLLHAFLNLECGCVVYEWFLGNKLSQSLKLLDMDLPFPAWIEVCHCSQICEMKSAALSVVVAPCCGRDAQVPHTGSTSSSRAENLLRMSVVLQPTVTTHKLQLVGGTCCSMMTLVPSYGDGCVNDEHCISIGHLQRCWWEYQDELRMGVGQR